MKYYLIFTDNIVKISWKRKPGTDYRWYIVRKFSGSWQKHYIFSDITILSYKKKSSVARTLWSLWRHVYTIWIWYWKLDGPTWTHLENLNLLNSHSKITPPPTITKIPWTPGKILGSAPMIHIPTVCKSGNIKL